MGPGVGIPFIAEGAITRGMALMEGTAYGQAKCTTGANVKIIGFALNDAADGQEVAVHPVTNGSAKCKGIASGSITRGLVVMAHGSTGKLKVLTPGTSLQYAAGILLEAATGDGQLVDILPCFFISVGAGA
jgi:hypothetical protein